MKKTFFKHLLFMNRRVHRSFGVGGSLGVGLSVFILLMIIFTTTKNEISKTSQKAIIIGATSGIGKALAQTLLENNYIVGATGRRTHLLSDLKEKYGDKVHIKKIDVTKIQEAIKNFSELVEHMKGVDLVVLSSGVGFRNPELQLEKELQTIAVNVSGFVAMANVAFKHFLKQKHGHLVGISSIASLFGNSRAPAYSASKAFENIYLDGLRYKAYKTNVPITVTNIMPGFVDTPMLKAENYFWVATPQEAAEQIYAAIVKKKTRAYVTRRWAIVAWILKILPDFICKRIF